MTLIASADSQTQPSRVGIGGPVGSGKTALVEALCKRLRDNYDIYVITNDIYTKEDQLIRSPRTANRIVLGKRSQVQRVLHVGREICGGQRDLCPLLSKGPSGLKINPSDLR